MLQQETATPKQYFYEMVPDFALNLIRLTIRAKQLQVEPKLSSDLSAEILEVMHQIQTLLKRGKKITMA